MPVITIFYTEGEGVYMAGREEWNVNGFQFESEKDAKQAKGELLKIQKLEDKMDYRNPHMIYAVYHKAIENRIFKTPLGYEYLRKLQKILEDSPLIREPVQAIPVNNVFSLRDSTNPAVERVKASQKPKPKPVVKKEFFSRTTSICVHIVLAVLVILMIYISTTGSRPTILNYEKALQNRYASWEQQLTERESVVREKEKALLIEEK